MSTKLRDLDGELGAAFRSADADAPGPDAKAALLATLGLGAVAAAGTAGAAGGAAAAGGSSALAAKTAGTFVALKWVIASAVIVSGAAATVHVVSAPAPIVVPAVVPAVVASPAATPAPPPRARDVIPPPATAASPAAPAPVDVADLPTAAPIVFAAPAPVASAAAAPIVFAAPAPVAAAAAAPAVRAESSTPSVVEEPFPSPRRATVADEIAKLDEARALLRAGRGAEAASAIADYRRTFPVGTLAEEAAVLEIESLASAGERDRASLLAARFAAAHPSSPLLPRVQRATP